MRGTEHKHVYIALKSCSVHDKKIFHEQALVRLQELVLMRSVFL